MPRALGVVQRQAIASAFEIGIHNGTLAIAVAISVLGSVELAVPGAVYSVIMFPAAALFGWAITRSSARCRRRRGPGGRTRDDQAARVRSRRSPDRPASQAPSR